MSKKILVLDYKTGNVDSVIKAIKLHNYDVIYSSNKKDLHKVSKIILPGQGTFDYAMNQLTQLEIINEIIYQVKKQGMPLLGICVGMQILSKYGLENAKTKGLNLIDGVVKPLDDKPDKLPHLGWSSVNFTDTTNKLFKNIENNLDFYFIHSYFFECKNKKNILAKTYYNSEFPAIVSEGQIYGMQFHPEKSLKNGMKLIENFLNINE
jgi:glutamine amidotransferase